MPGAGDRRHNAELVAASGAGLAVPAGRNGRPDLERLLHDPALRDAAGSLRDEIAALPAPRQVADRIGELVGTR